MTPTLKIKPSHPSQGDHVLINASDFDPARHALLDASDDLPDQPGGMKLADIKAQLGKLGISIPRNASKAECLTLLKENQPVATAAIAQAATN